MAYITSINNKPQMLWKEMKPKNTVSEDGVISLQMESGLPSILVRWQDVAYDLTLQYLTKAEVIEITQEVMSSLGNPADGKITLDFAKSEKSGYFDYKGTLTDITFIVTGNIKKQRIAGTDYWEITLPIAERFIGGV